MEDREFGGEPSTNIRTIGTLSERTKSIFDTGRCITSRNTHRAAIRQFVVDLVVVVVLYRAARHRRSDLPLWCGGDNSRRYPLIADRLVRGFLVSLMDPTGNGVVAVGLIGNGAVFGRHHESYSQLYYRLYRRKLS